ncbi:hypothetical protein [Microcoleus sp.]|uniref:hypothetical protein n=1 Tax=Microcoleus sp. TaxID=44472 RepID=UPI00403EDEDC
MANFLTRLVTRHLGLIPVVQPLIASMFASEEVLLGSDSLGFEAQTSSIDSFSEEERNWEAGKLARRGDGETGRRGEQNLKLILAVLERARCPSYKQNYLALALVGWASRLPRL